MRFRWGLAAVAVVAVLAGCKSYQQTGGVERTNANATIVSLAPSATEAVNAAFAADRIIGFTDACPATIRRNKPAVVTNTKIDYEKIAQLHPGIILYDSSLYSDLDKAKLEQTGAELFDYKVTSLESYEEQIYRLSSLIGTEVATSEYMDKVHEAQENYTLRDGETPVKTAVLMGGTGEYMAAGTKSFQADLVNSVGGNLLGPESDKFETVNVETLVQWNPEIIFSSGEGEQILKDPRLQSISAVRGKRVFDINPNNILRPNGQLDQVLKGLGTAISNYRVNRSR